MWQATATEGVPVYLLWFKDEIAVRMHQNPFEIVLIEAVDRPVV
jgi:tRNA A37 threonylcarbamoyladenosine synthetase subunit TsaC/SUA5/YrdC